MKRRFTFVFMSIVAAFCMLFGLVGCDLSGNNNSNKTPDSSVTDPNGNNNGGGTGNQHTTHNYGAWTITEEATCAEAGSRTRSCTGCDKTETEDIPALGHEIAAENKCVRYDKCGKVWAATEGLMFMFDSISDTYTVSGIGSASGDIVIPYTHEGKAVAAIGDSAFYQRSDITSITIATSVKSIGYSAFAGCANLTSVTLGSGLTLIGNGAFSDCDKLTSITLPDTVTTIDRYAFSLCDNLANVKLGNGSTSIDSSAFEACISLKSLTIPGSVTSIASGAFMRCELASVTFENPNGWQVTDIMGTSTTAITGLDNPATAAKYLCDTYFTYSWKRI